MNDAEDLLIRQRILLVDDSEVVREMVKSVLEEAGFEVSTHPSPFGFSRSVMRDHLDLVLMDVSMPALNGDKLVEIAIRNGFAKCPIVLFSDRPPHELAMLARRCGADGYIAKTQDARALVQAVTRFISA